MHEAGVYRGMTIVNRKRNRLAFNSAIWLNLFEKRV